MNEIRERFQREASVSSRNRLPMREGDFHNALNRRATPGAVILEAARRGVVCLLIYKRITDGKVERMPVVPVSYGYRKLRDGKTVKALWVRDVRDKMDKKNLKGLVARDILKAALTNTPAPQGASSRILEQMQE